MSSAMKKTTCLTLLAALLLAGGSAIAMGEDVASEPQYQADDSNSQVADSVIPVYSGGIGDDEIAYIKSVQHQYNTKILFTETNGEYLADLPVTIRGKNGETVVSTVTNGPVLLVNLPTGSYTVATTQDGTSREQKITVSGHKLDTVQFRFPGNDLTSQGNN